MCSLSTVYASSEDAADLFSRVEAVPRTYVLGALEANRTWSTPAEYIEAIDALPLGPNVSSLLGHSDLRAAVLGLDRATDDSVQPTYAELEKMAALLDQALEAGMLGMSGMDVAIDKLDGDRFRSRALPSTFATWRERRRLIKVLRKRGRMLQSAPDVERPASGLLFFLASSRILNRRKGVRMSMLVSADAKSMPLCDSSTCRFRLSCTPTESTCRSSRSSAPARLPFICGTSCSATNYWPMSLTGESSGRSSTASNSDRRCGIATFTTQSSSSVPTSH
jgi:N-acyl-D-aspartate/D-glutamate deacylase